MVPVVKPPVPVGAFGLRVQVIWVSVWLIEASVCFSVSLRLPVRFCAAVWFAVMPEGIAISMAMQKLRAMITSEDRILRLERFL
jgi:hypothetical protein